MPSGEATDFNLKYTDSGKVKSILISSKMLDYSNVNYPFTEFPKGIDVTMFDKNNKKHSSNRTMLLIIKNHKLLIYKAMLL